MNRDSADLCQRHLRQSDRRSILATATFVEDYRNLTNPLTNRILLKCQEGVHVPFVRKRNSEYIHDISQIFNFLLHPTRFQSIWLKKLTYPFRKIINQGVCFSIRIFQLTSFREQSTKNGGKTLGFPHQSQDHNTSPTKPNKTPRATPAINFIPPTTSTLILDEFVPDLGELVEVDVDVALDAEPVAEIVVELELEDEKIAIGILAIVVQVPPNKIISGLVKAEVKG